jgi:hypothetical protein
MPEASKPLETPKSQSRIKRLGLDALQLIGLSSFAVLQPLLALIAKNPAFLVAHKAKADMIWALILILALAVPAALWLVECLCALAGRRVLGAAHRLLATGLAFLIAMAPLSKVAALSWKAALGLAIACALVFAVLFARARWFRSFVTMTAFGALIFSINFAFIGPVGKLMSPKADRATNEVRFKQKPPIVMIVFDEFALRFLLDHDHKIDPVRFPNIAALAAGSNWYRNVTTVSTNTTYAVPAILTGQTPVKELMPIAKDYPGNLFTLLGHQYRMKVQEVVTGLCPQDLADTDKENQSLSAKILSTLSDAAVLYGYVLLPKAAWPRLPSIKHGWSGFVTSGQAPVLANEDDDIGYNFRTIAMNRFLDGIDPNEANVLHFMHLLLPHTPYDYLPTGQFYCPYGKDPEGLQEDKAWAPQDELIHLSEEEYLLQIGYVDRFVGRLVDKLKKANVYDKALIVLVADHGVSFYPKYQYRMATMNNPGSPDLLTMPLIIKLPRQKEGKIVDSFASTKDIMSTIADVLGCKLPWHCDGRSLLEPPLPGPHIIRLVDIYHEFATDQIFEWEKIIGFPFLADQIRLFGERTPLDQLTMRGPNDDLIGKKVDAFNARGDASLTIQHDQAPLFDKPIDMQGAFIPLYQSGRILGHAEEAPQPVAVAVNGVIRAVTQTYAHYADAEFRVVLPRVALQSGKNTIEFFVVDAGAGGSIELLKPRVRESFRITTSADGGRTLEQANGAIIPIKPGAVRGVLQPLDTSGESLVLSGWAIDENKKTPASEILVFIDDHFIVKMPVTMERPDLAKWLGDKYRNCGFYRYVPLDSFRSCQISAYAVSGNVASEVQYVNPVPGMNAEINNERFFFFPSLRLDLSGTSPTIRRRSGLPLGPPTNVIQGAVESIVETPRTVVIKGWAINSVRLTAPRLILAFKGEKLLGYGYTRDARPDISAKLGLDSQLPIGFNLRLNPLVAANDASIRVFVWSMDGGVAQLPFREGAPPALPSLTPAHPAYVLRDDGKTVSLVTSNGTAIQVQPGGARGVLQQPVLFQSSVIIAGWAIDEKAHRPAGNVIPFADGQYVGSLPMNVERKDLVGWLGKEYLNAGFYRELPSSLFATRSVRAFAVAGDRAFELQYQHETSPGKYQLADEPFVFDAYIHVKPLPPAVPKQASSPKTGLTPAPTKPGYFLRENGANVSLVTSTGTILPVQQNAVRGILQHPALAGASLIISGWAIDEKAHRPAENVILFADGRHVGSLPIKIERKDLAGWLGKDYVKSGFYQEMPKALFAKHVLRAFAIASGRASELGYYREISNDKYQLVDKPFAFDGELRVMALPPEALAAPSAPATPAVNAAEPAYALRTSDILDKIVTPDGKTLVVQPAAARGVVQQPTTVGGALVISGWAIDEQAHRPAESALIFANGKFIRKLPIKFERNDIAAWQGKEYLKSGFYEQIPLSVLSGAEIRVFAMIGDNVAEAQYSHVKSDGTTTLDDKPFSAPSAPTQGSMAK